MTTTAHPPLELIDGGKLTKLDEQAAKVLDGKIREADAGVVLAYRSGRKAEPNGYAPTRDRETTWEPPTTGCSSGTRA